MMDSVEEKMKTGTLVGVGRPQTTLLEEMKLLKEMQDQSGSRKTINSELWHACAGPLVSLPQVGSLVYYFPQGHSEQVAVSTKRTATTQIPNYPNLPAQLLCQVHNVTLHADKDTDEIYAQMSLQPVNTEKDVFPIPDFGLKTSKHPNEFFCKTLTASDTSTHGGFSVPRRAAEKLFPPLDYTMQPPTQELVVRDLHNNTWTFRHIYRGQPKRHLLTTGWSLFVGSKRLRAGDSVLFIRDEKSQLMVGIRRANRQQTALPSSVLSADSMHIGVLAAAAHAASNRSSFTIFYNPRACPSEFVIPLAKYRKSVYGTQISVGMRFGMMFETEESGKRRYMGTIIGTSDLDPLRWPGSKWRNLQVEWDEPGCSDKQKRVSSWEIETPESLFIFPSLTSGLKRPFHAGLLGAEVEWGHLMKRSLSRPEIGYGAAMPYSPIPNMCSEQLMKMMLKPQLVNHSGTFASSLPQTSAVKGAPLEEVKSLQATVNPKSQLILSENTIIESQNCSQSGLDQADTMNSSSSKPNLPERSNPSAGMALYLLGLVDIVLTDISPVMPALKHNLKRNKPVLNKALKTSVLYWNNRDQIRALNPPFDVVIAADVVYIEESAVQLLGAMEELVSDDGVVLLGYQLRSPEAHKLFWELCEKAFVIEKVPHEDLHHDYCYEEADVYILKKKKKENVE